MTFRGCRWRRGRTLLKARGYIKIAGTRYEVTMGMTKQDKRELYTDIHQANARIKLLKEEIACESQKRSDMFNAVAGVFDHLKKILMSVGFMICITTWASDEVAQFFTWQYAPGMGFHERVVFSIGFGVFLIGLLITVPRIEI